MSELVLRRIGKLLQDRARGLAVMGDYLDLLSEGARVAVTFAAPVYGWSVMRTEGFNRKHRNPISNSSFVCNGYLPRKFSAEPMTKSPEDIEESFGDSWLMADRALRVGLTVMFDRFDIEIPMFMQNNLKNATSARQMPGSKSNPIRDYFLRGVARTSTATPICFSPDDKISVAGNAEYVCLDGRLNPQDDCSKCAHEETQTDRKR